MHAHLNAGAGLEITEWIKREVNNMMLRDNVSECHPVAEIGI